MDRDVMKDQGKTRYIAPYLRVPPSAVLASQTWPPFNLGGSRPSPHTQTLTGAAIQPCVALARHLNGLHLRNPSKYMDYYLFTDPLRGWKAECAWLADP